MQLEPVVDSPTDMQCWLDTFAPHNLDMVSMDVDWQLLNVRQNGGLPRELAMCSCCPSCTQLWLLPAYSAAGSLLCGCVPPGLCCVNCSASLQWFANMPFCGMQEVSTLL
eukprot:GHRR01010849.1.p2 GENE.GHRR01010849.1~~GHRR01010849.1.p2  ORF type:complete len:110 (-),score=14.43 GHRR01010849.1:1607-1936(-)